MKKRFFLFSFLAISLVSSIACASTIENELNDVEVPGYNTETLLQKASAIKKLISKKNYTVISSYNYYKTADNSRLDIIHLLRALEGDTPNQIVIRAGRYFMNRPYTLIGAQGEGDWCNLTNRHCAHVKQDFIYRTDSFNCQTFVQTVLALLHAKNIDDFNKNILSIEYGAANEPPTSIHYYNRNNFISGDFNPINEKNGLMTNVTAQSVFAKYAKTASADITRQKWFKFQQTPTMLASNVRVIDAKNGSAMAKRFSNNYPASFHIFKPEIVAINYIPKQTLVKSVRDAKGNVAYVPNTQLINQIPTPAVIEIIRNVKKWKIRSKNIKDIIGSELNVSHMGFLYRQHFKNGELIYRKTTCHKASKNNSVCVVTPVKCAQKKGCLETMFLYANDAFPNSYYYYKDANEQYHCTSNKPSARTSYTMCNRVRTLPIGNYIASYQYGSYIYMTSPSLMGIHVEKIN